MIAQRIVKGLLSVCMVYVFVLVGANMLRYGQETGFSSDKEMVTASLNRMTTDRHEEEDSFIYLTGVQKADASKDSYVVGVSDFLDDIWQLFASVTEGLTIVMGFGMSLTTLFQQWGFSFRMGLAEHGLFMSGYVLA